MTDNQTVEAIRVEVSKNPFSPSYTLSGAAIRTLLRLSDYSMSRQLTMNSLRAKNSKLLRDNEKLKRELNRVKELTT